MELIENRARQFDLTGGVLLNFPWIRNLAPEYSGYRVLKTLNDELKNILMVRRKALLNTVYGINAQLLSFFTSLFNMSALNIA